jgi:hypothetical protein
MKLALSVVAIVVLMIGAQSAFAQTGALLSKHPINDMLSGYKHGVSDAQATTKHVYIWGPGHGFINQTDAFRDGYVLGFCRIAGVNASMDEDEADFYCSDGLDSAGWMVGPTIRSGGADFHRDPKLQVPSK